MIFTLIVAFSRLCNVSHWPLDLERNGSVNISAAAAPCSLQGSKRTQFTSANL